MTDEPSIEPHHPIQPDIVRFGTELHEFLPLEHGRMKAARRIQNPADAGGEIHRTGALVGHLEGPFLIRTDGISLQADAAESMCDHVLRMLAPCRHQLGQPIRPVVDVVVRRDDDRLGERFERRNDLLVRFYVLAISDLEPLSLQIEYFLRQKIGIRMGDPKDQPRRLQTLQ